MVAGANAIPDPEAVVVKVLDTIIAKAAMRATRWPADLASDAIPEVR